MPLTGEWHHLAGTNDSVDNRLYLDGELKAVGGFKYPMMTPAGTKLYFGGLPNQVGNSFTHGAVDEIGIYDRALTGDEIKALYQAGSQGKSRSYLAVSAASGSIIEAARLYLNGLFELSFNTEAGTHYTIQASSNLIDWIAITEIVGNGSRSVFIDPGSINLSRRYYRILQLPKP